MPNARPTPGLRLTPERRVEARAWTPGAACSDPVGMLRDLQDALHDLYVLDRLLRRAVAAQIGWDPLDGPGHECLTCGGSPTAHAEGCWVGGAQALLRGVDAALAASGQEPVVILTRAQAEGICQREQHGIDSPAAQEGYRAIAAQLQALTEWRRVRGLPEREGSGDGGGA